MFTGDIQFIKKCIAGGLVQSPCLELGVGYAGPNCKALVQAAGIEYLATDRVPADWLDYVIDFDSPSEIVAQSVKGRQFGTLLVLNVLEHTFNPIHVLDNVISILRCGGTCVLTVPVVWPLHNYPLDCWRINPNFYEEYCKRRGLRLRYDFFEYLLLGNVQGYQATAREYSLPRPVGSKLKTMRSRIIHRLFDPY